MGEARARRLTYVPALDGLRAVSVLLVVSYHLRGGHLLVLRGATGVLIFFVLSGFLITTLGQDEETATGRLHLAAFFLRRSARILPLYVLALGAYVVAVLVLHLDARQASFRSAIPHFLLFIPEVPIFRAGFDMPFAVAWSLGIEEKFYLGWSLLGFGLVRRAPVRAAVAGALLVGVLSAQEIDPSFGRYVVPYAFVLTGVLAATTRTGPMWPLLSRALAGSWAGLGAIGTVGFLAVHSRFGGDLWPVMFGAAVAALIVHLVVGTGPVVKALSLGPLVRVGRLSYGIYLFHQLFLGVGERAFPSGGLGDLLAALLGVALTVGTCAVLAALVERPAIRWGRARASGSRPGAAMAEAGTAKSG